MFDLFLSRDHVWEVHQRPLDKAADSHHEKLHCWNDIMAKEFVSATIERPASLQDGVDVLNESMLTKDRGDGVSLMPENLEHEALPPAELSALLPDQRRAYDIVDWHLKDTLAGRNPPQLLMLIPGEGGVGKSRTIQTITANFVSRGLAHVLVKCAYTGIAASTIGGKTIHVVAMIPTKGGRQSARALKRLKEYWSVKKYIIIDEMSMVSKQLLAKFSSIVSKATLSTSSSDADKFFGGLNVILVGDFHQFPPVVSASGSSLYRPMNPGKDTEDMLAGRAIYDQFSCVVRLKEQCRVTDPVWLDVLQHVRYGSCNQEHLNILRSLIISNPDCPPTDFTQNPWNKVVLITPRHSVRLLWNSAFAKEECAQKNIQLLHFPAEDTFSGRPLTLEERFAVARVKERGGKNRRERGGLPDFVDLFLGMKIMVTFNVNTDLDVANGSRGIVMDIVLDEREEHYDCSSSTVNLKYPPAFVLVKLDHTTAARLPGLPQGVLPISPIIKNFSVSDGNDVKKTILRRQIPITGGYAFTDYRGQGQTIDPVLIDIGTPPSGNLTPFNAYVALSRGRSMERIRLLRDFDDRLFTQHPCQYLRQEDERLFELDLRTVLWWESVKRTRS